MIIHVTPSYPPRLGGLEKVVQMLARTQAEAGRDVMVMTSDQGTGQSVQPEPFPVQRFKSFVVANTTIIRGLFGALLHIARTDIVHLHVTQAYTPEIVWLAAKLRGFKYVAHIHLDVPPSGPAGFLLKIYKPLFLATVLRGAHAVIVFTADQKIAVTQKYHLKPDRVKIIPNGVEKKYFKAGPRTLHRIPRLLFVGRLSYQKNLHQLLDALDGISNTVTTTIVGEGELMDELTAKASKLNLHNVFFTGRREGDKLKEYYERSDIFILPSQKEGMPLVALEAMAMKLPIIGTDVEGIRDIVVGGKNGLLVPLGDPRSLRLAIKECISDKTDYGHMSEAAGMTAMRYSWEHVATACTLTYLAQSE